MAEMAARRFEFDTFTSCNSGLKRLMGAGMWSSLSER